MVQPFQGRDGSSGNTATNLTTTRRYLLRCFSILPSTWAISLFGGEPALRAVNDALPTGEQSSGLDDCDWVCGPPQWWWKYVFPPQDIFYAAVVAIYDPEPNPWRQQISAILEGVSMLQSSAQVGDQAIAQRLLQAGINAINQGVQALTDTNSQ